jgi:hypothetical protein
LDDNVIRLLKTATPEKQCKPIKRRSANQSGPEASRAAGHTRCAIAGHTGSLSSPHGRWSSASVFCPKLNRALATRRQRVSGVYVGAGESEKKLAEALRKRGGLNKTPTKWKTRERKIWVERDNYR